MTRKKKKKEANKPVMATSKPIQTSNKPHSKPLSNSRAGIQPGDTHIVVSGMLKGLGVKYVGTFKEKYGKDWVYNIQEYSPAVMSYKVRVVYSGLPDNENVVVVELADSEYIMHAQEIESIKTYLERPSTGVIRNVF